MLVCTPCLDSEWSLAIDVQILKHLQNTALCEVLNHEAHQIRLCRRLGTLISQQHRHRWTQQRGQLRGRADEAGANDLSRHDTHLFVQHALELALRAWLRSLGLTRLWSDPLTWLQRQQDWSVAAGCTRMACTYQHNACESSVQLLMKSSDSHLLQRAEVCGLCVSCYRVSQAPTTSNQNALFIARQRPFIGEGPTCTCTKCSCARQACTKFTHQDLIVDWVISFSAESLNRARFECILSQIRGVDPYSTCIVALRIIDRLRGRLGHARLYWIGVHDLP